MINVASDKDATDATSLVDFPNDLVGAFCVACKPGYTPTFGTNSNSD